MHVEQLYTNCLAQATYYIESEGEAVIIDPLRDVEAYIEKAKQRGATIKYIFETHFHTDFVSGHLEHYIRQFPVGPFVLMKARDVSGDFQRFA